MTEVTQYDIEEMEAKELNRAKSMGYDSIEEMYEEMDRAQEAADRNSERSFE